MLLSLIALGRFSCFVSPKTTLQASDMGAKPSRHGDIDRIHGASVRSVLPAVSIWAVDPGVGLT